MYAAQDLTGFCDDYIARNLSGLSASLTFAENEPQYATAEEEKATTTQDNTAGRYRRRENLCIYGG